MVGMKPTFDNKSKRERWGRPPEVVDKNKPTVGKPLKIGSKVVAAPAPVQPLPPSTVTAAPSAAPMEPVEVLRGQATSKRVRQPADIGFKLFGHIDASALKVSRTIERLAGHLLGIPKNAFEFALLWPGSIRSLAAVHAVATISKWHEGDKGGARTLVYPARANIFQDLNHVLIDRIALAKLFAGLCEPGRGEPPNSRIVVSCPEKDTFFTALRSVRSADGTELQPTIGEVLPHYYSDQEFLGWKSCEGDLLKNLKTRLGDVHYTKALSTGAISRMGMPENAPDAIFGLGWRTPQEDIENALKALKKLGSPNTILVDVTRAARKNNPKWVRTTVRFLEAVVGVWPTDRPGVCIVADEPFIRNQLLQELARRTTKGDTQAARISQAGLVMSGHPCWTVRDGFVAENFIEPLSPTPKEIRVTFTDTHAAELIAQVDKLRSTAPDQSGQDLLSEVSRYLSRLASLPSSTRVLMDWLDQTGVPMAVRELYTWPTYRSKLQRLLAEPDFAEKIRLERIIKKCDTLWADYANGTPFARHLAKLIEEHTGGIEKCCVVFTKPTSRRLAERYFETYDGYPEGAGFEVLKDCVRMVVSGSLDAELGSRKNETIIFAGLDEISIRTLILDERISSPAYLLLTRRNAAYLKATLRSIDQLPAFSELGLRVKPLLKQLPDFPDEARALFTREDFVLPTFSFEQGLSAAASEDDSRDPDAWEIVLEDSSSIRRSPGARVYVHEPLYGYTQTRGFRGVEVRSLQPGQRLFVMSGELRELTEASLKDAGIDISHDKQFEASLRQYHNRILRAIDETLTGKNTLDQARELRQRILSGSDAPKGLPAEGSIKSWLNVATLLTAKFEDLTSQAPRQAEHFKAFAKAIGFSDIETVYFWKAVIQPLRGARRADGRRISDAYADMLLEPESAVVHNRMKPEVVEYLFSRAEENVYTIEAIKKPVSEEPHA
jgi:hypothetical protein